MGSGAFLDYSLFQLSWQSENAKKRIQPGQAAKTTKTM
jgi:hypothetical protein